MDSAPNVIPHEEDDPMDFRPWQGIQIELLRLRREESYTTVHLRFCSPRIRHEVLISTDQWRWVLQGVERAPVLVAHFQYRDGRPTHMIWSFPAPIGSNHSRPSYRYYSYRTVSSEIAISLTEDILQAQFGRSESRIPPTRQWMWITLHDVVTMFKMYKTKNIVGGVGGYSLL